MAIRCTNSTFVMHSWTGVTAISHHHPHINMRPFFAPMHMALVYINNVYQGWGNVNAQRKYDQRHTSLTPRHDSACMRIQDDGLAYVGMRVHHENIENPMKIRLLLHRVHACKKHVILVKKYDYTSKIEEIVGINT